MGVQGVWTSCLRQGHDQSSLESGLYFHPQHPSLLIYPFYLGQSDKSLVRERQRGWKTLGGETYHCARNPPERSSCEIFVRDRRKMRRNFGNFFRSFNFQGKWSQTISRTILDIFHIAPNKVLFLWCNSGGWGPNIPSDPSPKNGFGPPDL